jgi:exodeoxyribonuclease VII large subunit
MDQYTLFQPDHILTVSQLTGYMRQLLEGDDLLQDLWVQGEISNFAQPSSGHLYFTLKDSEAAVRCVMWRNAAARLKFNPHDGLAVEAHGGMGIYEVSGQVQLYIDTLKPAGEGALYQEFLRLKATLEAEGLFDLERKRSLPKRPRTIGIVTSPTGAALQDMLNTLRRRFPIVNVILAPTAVQGIDAPAGIVAALQRLNTDIHPDVILIGRGGGSIEDLWAFNDENVARAVAGSAAPVISGVGHETDFTLTDFAADLRAPTPTAAAEVATPDKIELQASLVDIANQQTTLLLERISSTRYEFNQVKNSLEYLSPAHDINTYRQRLDEVALRLNHAAQVRLKQTALQLQNLQQALRSLNPQAVLQRGYAIVTRTDTGDVVKNADQVQLEDHVHIQVSQGTMDARITQTSPGDRQ